MLKKSAIKDCRLLASAMPVQFNTAANNQVSLQLPQLLAEPCTGIQVIKITMKN